MVFPAVVMISFFFRENLEIFQIVYYTASTAAWVYDFISYYLHE